ncbi:uncharacterized protein HGUI_01547 [Hanseniaspora guilliermondii]|uniref:ATP-dependent RNA helicase DHR2 n=1 Tax=Hanseniaspora guilliermondii TaxID=56406 RepID=A0A1L0B321_9ASCO|nr:uncharacterized protein HGUI_01547 [Hanseniaspora guilliermondii]
MSEQGSNKRQKTQKQGAWEKAQLQKNDIDLNKLNSQQQNDFDFVFKEDFGFESDSEQSEEESEEEESEQEDVSLPIEIHKKELLDIISKNQVVIIIGHTGSGKSTKMPQFLCNDLDRKKICITQPRRLAAISIAQRVSKEMNVELGKEVGYGVRFDEKFDKSVGRIKYATDGILLKELTQTLQNSREGLDRRLQYDTIIIDEAHERTLNNDIILSLMKYQVLPNIDKNFKLIITSATINAQKFSEFFGGCPIYEVEGKNYPVKINYLTKEGDEDNYLENAISTIMKIYKDIKDGKLDIGDVLVFLTGQDEINFVMKRIQKEMVSMKINSMVLYPIYANLPLKEQVKIFESIPRNCFKVILATNIAETSITLPNIKYVVDSGKIKVKTMNVLTQISELVIESCSRAQANQRAGRTGRTGPGTVYRLYSRVEYAERMKSVPIPEILRESLSKVLVQLLRFGLTISEILKELPMMDKPDLKQWRLALQRLLQLEGINNTGELTYLGKFMCDLPSDIGIAKVLSVAASNKCVRSCCIITAMLEEFKLPINNKAKEEENLRGISLDGMDVFKHYKHKIMTHKDIHGDDCLGDLFFYLLIYLDWAESGYNKEWCEKMKLSFKMMNRIKYVYKQLIQTTRRYYENEEFDEDMEKNLKVFENFNDIKYSFIKGYPNNLVKLESVNNRNGVYRHLKNALDVKNVTLSIHPSSVLFDNKELGLIKNMFYITILKTNKEFIKDGFQVEDDLIKEV